MIKNIFMFFETKLVKCLFYFILFEITKNPYNLPLHVGSFLNNRNRPNHWFKLLQNNLIGQLNPNLKNFTHPQ